MDGASISFFRVSILVSVAGASLPGSITQTINGEPLEKLNNVLWTTDDSAICRIDIQLAVIQIPCQILQYEDIKPHKNNLGAKRLDTPGH